MQNDHRHVALQALLLIDRERSTTVLDHVHHAGAQVKASQVHVSTNSFDSFSCCFTDVWANCQNAVDAFVSLKCGGCTGFDLCRVVGHVDHVQITTNAIKVTCATVNQCGVERFLIEAKTVGHAFGCGPLARLFTSQTLWLTDVH